MGMALAWPIFILFAYISYKLTKINACYYSSINLLGLDAATERKASSKLEDTSRCMQYMYILMWIKLYTQ